MKKISVVIPCYNEEENVGPITAAVSEVFRNELPDLDYEILLIDNDDCGTTRTTPIDFSDGMCRVKDFIGRTVREGEQDVVITEDNMKQFEGRKVNMYSPMTCATPHNLCYKCCGRRAKDLGADVVGIQVIKITSKFMLTSMKNMHGTVLQVVNTPLERMFL